MTSPTDPDQELRSLYPISAMRPAVQDEVIALVKMRETEARLDTEEYTLRYAIQIFADTNKDFALENLQRQLDKNLRSQEESH